MILWPVTLFLSSCPYFRPHDWRILALTRDVGSPDSENLRATRLAETSGVKGEKDANITATMDPALDDLDDPRHANGRPLPGGRYSGQSDHRQDALHQADRDRPQRPGRGLHGRQGRIHGWTHYQEV